MVARRRLVPLVTLALSIALVSSVEAGAHLTPSQHPRESPAARIHPALESVLASVSAGVLVPVVVVLSDQVDRLTIGGQSPHARAVAARRALRDVANASQRPVVELLEAGVASGAVTRIVPLWIVNAVATTATPAVIRAIARTPGIAEVVPEQKLAAPTPSQAGGEPPPEANIQRVGAPAMWDLGFHGEGATVAVLDTGVDVSNPDLAAAWRGGDADWFDPYGEHPTSPADSNGHGTEVLGVVVGGGAGGTAVGVAPGATWIAAKIFDDDGQATTTAIHQAFQWVLDPDADPDTPDEPDIVNASWSFAAPGCDLTFAPDLAAVAAAGIAAVAAAGNFGPDAGTSVSPANNPNAISVGAVDDFDALWSGSSRGPTSCGRSAPALYPSLVAPGVDIATTGRWAQYVEATGTSLATPHVSGALALLRSAHPDQSIVDLRDALAATAVDVAPPGPDDAAGAGRIDVVAAHSWLLGGPGATPVATPAATLAPTGPPGDTAGPNSGPVVAAPDPSNGSTPVTVSASIDDGLAGGSGIDAAELFVDAAGPDGTGAPMSGAFGAPATTVSATLASSSLAELSAGAHRVLVRGRDAVGNWGPLAETWLTIDRSPPTTTSVGSSPRRTDGAAQVTLSATVTDDRGVGSAEYAIDASASSATWLGLQPTDGAFGEPVEGVLASVPVEELSPGEHIVWVRGRDEAGSWGQPIGVALYVTPPGTIFADGFETGTLSAWQATGASRLATRSAAASAGHYGLRVRLVAGARAYVVDRRPAAEASYRAAFTLDASRASLGATPLTIMRALDGHGRTVLRLQLRRLGPVDQVRLVVARAGGTTATSWVTVGSGRHAAEIAWRRGHAGAASVAIDGIVRGALTAIDTSGRRVEAVRLGAVSRPAAGVGGWLDIDRFVSTRGVVIDA